MSETRLRLEAATRAAFENFSGRIGVAVSGGSDSLALLHLCVEAFGADRVCAATVDHQLRPDSADEAETVGRIAAQLGVGHHILKWNRPDEQGNLSDQARRARYRLLVQWAEQSEVAAVAIGHTADDQAETFLMRLARRSGLSGLAAMPERRDISGIAFLRPLLSFRREDLRDYLRSLDVAWVDDPTNFDERYERVRMRAALPELEQHGIGPGVLADVARQLSDARAVVDQVAYDFLIEHTKVDKGDLLVSRDALRSALPEIRRRVLAHALNWVSGASYGPRSHALTRALSDIDAGRDTVLHGCLMLCNNKQVRICRELAAVSGKTVPADAVWDERWVVEGPGNVGPYSVTALGAEGLLDCPDWRGTGRPRASLLASPAIWRGERLIAAPVAGYSNGWKAELSSGTRDFYMSILSR